MQEWSSTAYFGAILHVSFSIQLKYLKSFSWICNTNNTSLYFKVQNEKKHLIENLNEEKKCMSKSILFL